MSTLCLVSLASSQVLSILDTEKPLVTKKHMPLFYTGICEVEKITLWMKDKPTMGLYMILEIESRNIAKLK